MNQPKKVVIVGGGFAGLNAARALAKESVSITLIDRRNHHLFQPLLYQVAMAGLSPADIAAPIRSLLSNQRNVEVICGEVQQVIPTENRVTTTIGDLDYDYLLLACGAMHSYFGNQQWEPNAPGLKSLEQAIEIRRRVLQAFEQAELTENAEKRRQHMTFVVGGAGPTGVELAGALGEMSRFTLAKDFQRIDPKQARVILIEAGKRILPMFSDDLAARAMIDLERLGVQTWTEARVTDVSKHGVEVSGERINASTVLWSAGTEASAIGKQSHLECDRAGRIIVRPDLSVANHTNLFVAGDQCCFQTDAQERPLPGVAPVAVQQGIHFAKVLKADMTGSPRPIFEYQDKGQMATIGRSKAIMQSGKLKLTGFTAWMAWLLVHIYYLTGFKNRLFVILSWAWSYLTFRRGTRLILNRQWRSFPDPTQPSPVPPLSPLEHQIQTTDKVTLD